jgi:hypothetical protein
MKFNKIRTVANARWYIIFFYHTSLTSQFPVIGAAHLYLCFLFHSHIVELSLCPTPTLQSSRDSKSRNGRRREVRAGIAMLGLLLGKVSVERANTRDPDVR